MRRASHVADQHGAGAAGEPGGLRLRLHPGRAAARAHAPARSHTMAGAGAAPGSLLQLVRHAVAAAAAAALRLVGGQRQPRRPPADPAARARWRWPTTGSSTALVRRPGRHAARRSPTPSAARSRRRSRACSGISRPPTTRGPRRSPRRGSWLDRLGAGIAEVAAQGAAAGPIRRRAGAAERSGVLGGDALVAAVPRSCATSSSFSLPWSALPDAPRGAATSRASRRSRRCASSRRSTRRCRRRSSGGARTRRRGPRVARCAAPGRGDASRAPRADRRRSSASRAVRRARAHGVRLPLRPGAPPAGHRLQRRRAPARRELLRPARLGSAARELRRDRAGPAAAGELVRARAPAHDRRRASRCCCRGAARCSST